MTESVAISQYGMRSRMPKTESEKEHTIARYLAELECFGDETEEQKETMANTTPNPEQAHDILQLIRRLDQCQ